jgi:small redox-active disulfide protein 2
MHPQGETTMKNVKVYGPGCKRCEATEAMIREAASRLGVEVEVEKVTDAKSIAMAGVLSTPGVAVDGRLVHAGGLPDAAKVERWLGA